MKAVLFSTYHRLSSWWILTQLPSEQPYDVTANIISTQHWRTLRQREQLGIVPMGPEGLSILFAAVCLAPGIWQGPREYFRKKGLWQENTVFQSLGKESRCPACSHCCSVRWQGPQLWLKPLAWGGWYLGVATCVIDSIWTWRDLAKPLALDVGTCRQKPPYLVLLSLVSQVRELLKIAEDAQWFFGTQKSCRGWMNTHMLLYTFISNGTNFSPNLIVTY